MDVDTETEPQRGTKRKADDDGPASEPPRPRRIQALDPNVVNKIAAGEIIIAPVHALKELVENAVDAGSTMLEVLVKDGGLKLLQITDNGCGIEKDDLPILCDRFTTSKLQRFEDLEAIATYGFRGEALASISHIAHLTVTTRTRDAASAWRACYEAGQLAPSKPGQDAAPKRVAGRPGTQITVEDLFYNAPTRRRAFRSTSDEYNKIVDMLGRYAVHCSGVAFACKKHGEASASIAVPAAASTVDRIRHVYGGAVAHELLAFATEDRRWGFAARGWATTANYSLKRTTLLLFINNRCVESTNIRKALDETYAAFLPKNGHPFVYLSLTIDPQRVDVNVHPTKREVNFLNEDEVTRAVCEHIRAKLAEVDTSRTFATQTLLSTTRNDAGSSQPRTPASAAAAAATAARKTPLRPYENNLVRTDTNLRKITSMFAPAPSGVSQPHSPLGSDSAEAGPTVSGGASAMDDEDDDNNKSNRGRYRLPEAAVTYEVVDREPTVNWLKSVRELKEDVVADADAEATKLLKSLSFVGIVDARRRLAAIQSDVRLYLVDYGRTCYELFYQLGLSDFGNFGALRFSPPLDLRALLLTGLREAGTDADADINADAGAGANEDEIVTAVAAQLVERRQMLQEYFLLEVTPTGELLSLPLLLKGYTPPLAKLPQFLLRLGPRVHWHEEKACFATFLRELARFYVPEQLSPAAEGDGDDDDDSGDSGEGHKGNAKTDDGQSRRAHVEYAVEHVLFPAFKAQLIGTTSLMQAGVVEVANLKGLYRVFERC
ncbi:DNA mismatch repair protein [Niveomyces insectorum RCEF 264]|uniref:DNA mismatch repair protein n=1 Tax=Niveomyces insectorum RCEF 264 TaxID=1081102 RepID=A0A162ICV3_9HYPO|nr:DNA mismatch repair protein [Niveomyces insectorum RCEF 264]